METNHEYMNTIIIRSITFRLRKNLDSSHNYSNSVLFQVNLKDVFNTRYSKCQSALKLLPSSTTRRSPCIARVTNPYIDEIKMKMIKSKKNKGYIKSNIKIKKVMYVPKYKLIN